MQHRKHAVVTGGSGFVGSHLVDLLRQSDCRVTVLDNFGSGRRENLAATDSSALTVLEHDVTEPFPQFETVDEVYHLASRASPTDFDSHPVSIARTNSEGTRHALELTRRHDATMVLASTSEVYGDPEVNPQPETYRGNVSIRGPRAPYDESKRFAEALSGAYRTQYGLDVRTVRIFNTYGPRMRADDGRVIPTFLRQAIQDRPLTVYGNGGQTRSFCYVSDLVTGIHAVAEADESVMAGEVVNLGHTREITIQTLAETVLDVLETDARITYEQLPTDDPSVRCPDISRAQDRLGWEPTVTLETGLRRTAIHLRDQLDGIEQ